ncbi:hypothetical protein PtB15_14B314 [Puccinia triticina]|nr:hypothetical protein PtB15_14B314 [Puccinia triticina]
MSLCATVPRGEPGLTPPGSDKKPPTTELSTGTGANKKPKPESGNRRQAASMIVSTVGKGLNAGGLKMPGDILNSIASGIKR